MTAGALVARSAVPPGKKYEEYRQVLRYDFFYQCAYCTMSEAEALAIRFVTDHYEPRKPRPDLIDEYTNLMYCCDQCNLRKGDRCPPPGARAVGRRFFRPDHDAHDDHFKQAGILLESKSNVGSYSIDALDLNRHALQRIRNLRQRLTECERYVAGGVLALRKFPLDQLPQHMKGRVATAIKGTIATAADLADRIDSTLRELAKSDLIDPDPESQSRNAERAARLKSMESLHPGNWRARRQQRG